MGFKLEKEKRKKLEDLKLAESRRVVLTEGTLIELLDGMEEVLGESALIALLYSAGLRRGRRVVEYLKEEEKEWDLEKWLDESLRLPRQEGIFSNYKIDLEKGKIYISNSIECRLERMSGKSYGRCCFTQGYISGILNSLIEGVKVKEVVHKKREGEDFLCIYEIK